ncbi:hypothetical protein UF75_2732 [Desulfosporosinus sp. I2]|uniref:hypothetical protein n=1 Tax=Desulfosporosinus sp. I2 TaxID=1617025 RepID=UPI00061F50F4|nr:hypothetical protein [Desulfosporosinus sp. I2]KJR46870.1 hypothetical protein UF75_2732 [Desulfosporosinus sp. I2]
MTHANSSFEVAINFTKNKREHLGLSRKYTEYLMKINLHPKGLALTTAVEDGLGVCYLDELIQFTRV